MSRSFPALFLSAVLGAQAPSSDVAIGVFPFLVGNMDARVNEIATNCQTRGIDTLYVSVFRATGPQTGDLWVTDSAGDWNPQWGPVRSGGAGIHLVNLIAACHAVNVRVVGVLKCFDDTVQPDNLAHRQYLLNVIDYFVDAWQPNGQPVYDLDGFALDYVRYVGSSSAVPANVTNFVADVRQRIGGMSLHAYLIANRFTFDGPVYNGNFNSYASVKSQLSQQYGQDWEQLAPLLDVLMPMAYTADGSIYSTYALHQAYVQKTAEYARQACALAGVPGRRVCPVVKTYVSSGETTTTPTIQAAVTCALLGGGGGYQSFRYQQVVDNPSWWTPLQAYAVPGCNWPRPLFTASSPRLTTTYDPAGTSDLDQPAGSLELRFDYDGDGAFDTPWQPNATVVNLTRYPSAWTTTMQARDAQGHASTTRRRYSAGSPIQLFPLVLNTTWGGAIHVFLDVGPAGAGDTYLAIAGLSGTSPGFLWAPGFPVPLNIDAVTAVLAGQPNGPLFVNGFGTFNAQGRATATLNWPPQILSFLAGFTLHWSVIAQDAQGNPRCVGDSKPLLLQ